MQQSLVTRFAPSPTGHLHLGHILSMAYVYGIAKQLNARLLLRIEDHDKERCKEEFVQSIINDIEWMNLLPDNWDDVQTKGKEARYRQSFRLERYKQALDKLELQGLLYRCKCSRSEILERTKESHRQNDELYYDGYCRNENYSTGSIRLRLSNEEIVFYDAFHGHCMQNPLLQCGDLQLVDRHNNNTYNFAVVVDDIADGVNLIIRGTDLLSCTGRQCFLQRKLEKNELPLFCHHPLILDHNGEKLSKRLRSTGLETLRKQGMKPEQVLGLAFQQAGIINSLQQIDKRKLPDLCKIALQ